MNSPAAQSSVRAGHGRLLIKIAGGVLLLGLALWLGRSFGHHLPAMEEWIARQGAWGYLAFTAIVVVSTSLFVPDTVLAVAAGALFGVGLGTVTMVVSSLLTAALNYTVGRLFLKRAVVGVLDRQPKLAAIVRAVNAAGFRLQFLLRLTPINPVTLSYALGATGARFATFLPACLGLAPSLFVEVYFGYVAKHIAKSSAPSSESSALHTTLTVGGLLLCVVVLVYVVRIARRAIAESEQAESEKSAS